MVSASDSGCSGYLASCTIAPSRTSSARGLDIGQFHLVCPTESIMLRCHDEAGLDPFRIQLRAKTRHFPVPNDQEASVYKSRQCQCELSNFLFTLERRNLHKTSPMDGPDSATFWLDIAEQDSTSRSWQDEPVQSKTVEDPVRLFGRFVSVISSDTLKNIRTPEVL
jgi:hypothetical protein